MSGARQTVVEPQQVDDDPVNALLDLAEAALRTVIDVGARVALGERVKRLLPELSPAPIVTPPVPSTPDGSPRDTAEELDLALVVTVTQRLARFRLSAHEHEAIRRVHDWAAVRLPAKTGRAA